MASIRTFRLPHYHAYPVHVALFEDVENADFLKSQLLAANPDFDYAFLDAAMSPNQGHLPLDWVVLDWETASLQPSYDAGTPTNAFMLHVTLASSYHPTIIIASPGSLWLSGAITSPQSINRTDYAIFSPILPYPSITPIPSLTPSHMPSTNHQPPTPFPRSKLSIHSSRLISSTTILSPSHLLTSAFLTLHAFATTSPTRSPKTRTPHSELVFRLSPNNNIGQSYSLFGIGPHTTRLIAVKLGVRIDDALAGTAQTVSQAEEKVSPRPGRLVLDDALSAQSVGAHLASVVRGRSVPIGEMGVELGAGADVGRIRKVYKLGEGGGGRKGGSKGAAGEVEEEEEERKALESVILGIMSLKGS
ncbi:hypothetical protein LEMA_P068890.1 [Plenodomus lingam JN3]|uniref:EKC/KEOPS complex subunit CGI121 n=1 Tax=Leptosphaeria maculans (strain JN3 / isolate v23.1.3 / race Av1-4-5-6-7-8) TaxID=985895 RepID=E4ZJU6_LEPMJ|nr:hypothetical protein LEMA_P068890.1 [Plenodomus lingam JN3]CBX91381.1 hypothetical protein LEMA_P068890.1 [Plenodomus lingam JN3]